MVALSVHYLGRRGVVWVMIILALTPIVAVGRARRLDSTVLERKLKLQAERERLAEKTS